ncbi:MAG: hypothetical protein HC902_01760 [Calothrix sp. SM1_5_4]|nr:hypothetical protein [Calothrix sp. SM1_5_4]
MDLDRRLRGILDQGGIPRRNSRRAVSDYSVEHADTAVKLKTESQLTLKLRANAKILPRLKAYAKGGALRVIGFKLTLNASAADARAAAISVLSEGVEAVVANDWSRVRADRSRHPGFILTRDGEFPFADLHELGGRLDQLLREDKNGSLS